MPTDPALPIQPSPPAPEQSRSFRESVLAMLGLCFVNMMAALDQTVVGTALPTIVAELKGFEFYPWVATAYLLTSVMTIPIFGRLGDYFGRKYFVLVSTVLFTLASALCGMADSMLFLVLARALQGIAGGMLIGTTFACIPDLFPEPHVRLRWQVMFTTSFGIANAIGPSLGGFLTEFYGWRWVFLVNLPIGVLCFWFLSRHMPHIRHMRHDKPIRLDWLGAMLIACGLGSLILFVEWIAQRGFDGGMIALGLFSLTSFVGLYHWEQRCPQPILPSEMFRNPALAALFTLSALAGFIMFALLFYTPLLLQGGFGLSPNHAGQLITPLVLCITFGSLANSRILPRLPNPVIMLYLGFTLLAISGVGIATLKQASSHWLVVACLSLSGLGLGFTIPNLTIFTQQVAGRTNLGIATALIQSLRMVGGMLGTAFVGILFHRIYISEVSTSLTSLRAVKGLPELIDPQILVNKLAQNQFIVEMQSLSLDGGALIEAARVSLVSSLHIAELLSIAVALIGLWQLRRVPPVKLKRDKVTAPAPVAGD